MVSCHDQDPDQTHRHHHHLHGRGQTLLQIKQESKFFSRLLSKESSRANTSCRDRVLLYYGGAAGAIPFVWESRPGTPKHTLCDTASLIPPLTPPPSYQSTTPRSRPVKFSHSSKPTLLVSTILFPARRGKKAHATSPSSSLSSGSSTSSSWSSSSSPFYFKSNPQSSAGSKRPMGYEEYYGSSPRSACVGKQRTNRKRIHGCFPVARAIKSACLSLVGHRASVQASRG